MPKWTSTKWKANPDGAPAEVLLQTASLGSFKWTDSTKCPVFIRGTPFYFRAKPDDVQPKLTRAAARKCVQYYDVLDPNLVKVSVPSYDGPISTTVDAIIRACCILPAEADLFARPPGKPGDGDIVMECFNRRTRILAGQDTDMLEGDRLFDHFMPIGTHSPVDVLTARRYIASIYAKAITPIHSYRLMQSAMRSRLGYHIVLFKDTRGVPATFETPEQCAKTFSDPAEPFSLEKVLVLLLAAGPDTVLPWNDAPAQPPS